MADWQQLTTLAITGLAAGYLVLRLARYVARPSRGGCGTSCGGCSGPAGREKPLVPLTLAGGDAPAAGANGAAADRGPRRSTPRG